MPTWFHTQVSEVIENRTDGQKGEDVLSYKTTVVTHAPTQEYANLDAATIPQHALT